MKWFGDLLALVGLSMIATGFWQIHPTAGMVFVGAVFLVFGVLIEIRSDDDSA